MSLLAGTAAWAQPQPGTLDLHTGGTTPTPPSPTPTPAASEPEVLVAEVVVEGTDDPELIDQVYKVIRTRAGEVSTRSQLREDINAVFATGFFADVRAVPSDTPLGVRVTFEVKPNPVLKAVRTEGTKVLDLEVLRKAFAEQEGRVLNFGKLQAAVEEIEQWYADKGYVLAKVIDVRTSEDGTLTLEIAEGEIEDIRVQGNTKTRDFIITRELKTKPGDVFNRNQIQEDLQAVFNLNLFQDVNVGLNPGRDPNKVVVVVNVEERRTGTLSGTLGVSSATGVFAGLSVSEENLGGNNQKASFNVQVGTNETLFDLNFTDPRIATLEIPTSYSVNISNQQSSSFVFNEGLTLPNGDPVRINRLGGSITFSRPLGGNWRASLGARVQFVEARNSKGEQERFDVLGNPITFSASGQDSYTSLRLGLIHDTRDNLNTPSQGSVFRLFTEQSVRLFQNGLNANRLEASYSQFIPVKLFETRSERPQVLAFDVRAGTTLGDLAPYDAFPIGGGNSVRGFFEGGIGSGRSFATATAELRFPLFDPVGVVVFADYGTDLGSGAAVIGNPAAVRNKPGSGLGLGAGIRIQSPLGPLRIDYAVGQGEAGRAQLHFGIGEKF
ncbi:BamA/TamA family outer membrane protein [Synechococcus sp. O70.1]|jgi:outer membrane protein insertion porin family|uniref:BamA/TamA family outer membrane protein n=1 Tax=unclassified Synechococcus TaxID=2626047 RepID=UPI0039C32601